MANRIPQVSDGSKASTVPISVSDTLYIPSGVEIVGTTIAAGIEMSQDLIMDAGSIFMAGSNPIINAVNTNLTFQTQNNTGVVFDPNAVGKGVIQIINDLSEKHPDDAAGAHLILENTGHNYTMLIHTFDGTPKAGWTVNGSAGDWEFGVDGGTYNFCNDLGGGSSFQINSSTVECNKDLNVNADLRPNGNFKIVNAGNGIFIKEGTNATSGSTVLVGGTKVVSTNKVAANSRIYLTSNIDGGVPGFLRVSTRTAGTSFTITSSNILDTSTVSWLIIAPA